MATIADKILTSDSLEAALTRVNFRSQKVVFTNGCFDLLHLGHLAYLAEASSLADILIVGLNNDTSVKKLKGNNRPIHNQETRAHALAAMYFVDYVILFEEETPLNLITQIKPDVLVKGGDWEIDQIVGSDIVLQNGGEVKSLQFIEGHSTTSIIEKIQNLK